MDTEEKSLLTTRQGQGAKGQHKDSVVKETCQSLTKAIMNTISDLSAKTRQASKTGNEIFQYMKKNDYQLTCLYSENE